jgi:hypothetical protein
MITGQVQQNQLQGSTMSNKKITLIVVFETSIYVLS